MGLRVPMVVYLLTVNNNNTRPFYKKKLLFVSSFHTTSHDVSACMHTLCPRYTAPITGEVPTYTRIVAPAAASWPAKNCDDSTRRHDKGDCWRVVRGRGTSCTYLTAICRPKKSIHQVYTTAFVE